MNLSLADLLTLVIAQSQTVTVVAQTLGQGNSTTVTLNTLGGALKRLNEVATTFAQAYEAEIQKQQEQKAEQPEASQANGATA